jgi:hypothetical protein
MWELERKEAICRQIDSLRSDWLVSTWFKQLLQVALIDLNIVPVGHRDKHCVVYSL